jgi:hypothetical protein
MSVGFSVLEFGSAGISEDDGMKNSINQKQMRFY